MKKETRALIRDMNEQIQSMQNELSDARARMNMLWGIVKKREEEGIESLKKYGYSSTPAIETEDIRWLFGWGPSKARKEMEQKIGIIPEQIQSEEKKVEPIEEESDEDKRKKSIKKYTEKILSLDKKEDREERNRRIIEQKESGDYTLKQIAEMNGCSEATVCAVVKKWRENS